MAAARTILRPASPLAACRPVRSVTVTRMRQCGCLETWGREQGRKEGGARRGTESGGKEPRAGAHGAHHAWHMEAPWRANAAHHHRDHARRAQPVVSAPPPHVEARRVEQGGAPLPGAVQAGALAAAPAHALHAGHAHAGVRPQVGEPDKSVLGAAAVVAAALRGVQLQLSPVARLRAPPAAGPEAGR